MYKCKINFSVLTQNKMCKTLYYLTPKQMSNAFRVISVMECNLNKLRFLNLYFKYNKARKLHKLRFL